MPPGSRDEYLRDALEAADLIIDWTGGISKDVYLGNRQIQSAVERQFDVFSEAVRNAERLDPGLADALPNIRQIKDHHVVLAHLCFTVDNDIMWQAAMNTLPETRQRIDRYLNAN